MSAYERLKKAYPVKPYPLPRVEKNPEYWELWDAANREVDFEIYLDDVLGRHDLGDGYIGRVRPQNSAQPEQSQLRSPNSRSKVVGNECCSRHTEKRS